MDYVQTRNRQGGLLTLLYVFREKLWLHDLQFLGLGADLNVVGV